MLMAISDESADVRPIYLINDLYWPVKQRIGIENKTEIKITKVDL